MKRTRQLEIPFAAFSPSPFASEGRPEIHRAAEYSKHKHLTTLGCCAEWNGAPPGTEKVANELT